MAKVYVIGLGSHSDKIPRLRCFIIEELLSSLHFCLLFYLSQGLQFPLRHVSIQETWPPLSLPGMPRSPAGEPELPAKAPEHRRRPFNDHRRGRLGMRCGLLE